MEQEQQTDEQATEMGDETLIAFGTTIKALGDGKVGGHLVRFSDPEDTDLEQEFFDASTDYGGATSSAVYYNHGIDPTLQKRKFTNPASLGTDDVGVWIEHQLDLRDKYEHAVYSLAEKGKLGWSSGTAPHLVEYEPLGAVRRIKAWPLGLDASYTPTPADPKNRVGIPLKSWAEVSPALQVEPETADTAAVATTKGEQPVEVHVHIHQGDDTAKSHETPAEKQTSTPPERAITEDMTMSEQENVPVVAETQPVVDVAAIAAQAAQKAAEEAVKAYQAKLEADRLEKQGPVKTPGYVTEAAEDRALKGNPYRSFGEFLMAVKNAESNVWDDKLRALRSGDQADEGGFNVGKALGAGFVGSLTNAGMAAKGIKAASGLNELVPSDGGFLVGTDRAAGLLARVYDVGQLLQRVSMVGISASSNGMSFYAEDETSRADGSRRGGVRGYWMAEAAQHTDSRPSFREMNLKLRKVGAFVYCTDELLADAQALESYILQNVPEEVSFVVEDSVINGDGVGKPQGILNSNALVSVGKETGQAAATLVAENIIKMWARRWVRAQDYVWLVNQDVTPQLHQMSIAVGTGGQLVYMPPGGLSASPYGSLMGRPVLEVEYCQTLGTKGDIYLASLNEFQMIEKGGVEAASSIHVRFDYGETAYRFIYRVDGQSKWNEALTPFKGSNSVSPFVALDARS